MARIVALSIWTNANDLGGRLWNPAIRWTTKHAVFVEIETDEGRTGLGECWCFDASPDALVAYLSTEVAPAVLGLDLDALEDASADLIRKATLTSRHGILMSALSGVDIAVHDLRAQAAGVPLHQALSPTGPGTVTLYGSGGLYGQGKDAAALASEMSGMAANGFRCMKLKIGAVPVDDDLARVRAVLDTLPPDCKLILDAVYSYTPETALRVFEALPQDRIEAFQSPVAAHDVAGMAWLTRAGVPVMAVEAEHRPELHSAMIAADAVKFLQTAPIACGGISRVRALSAELSGTPIQLSLEVSSTAVALMAACHLAASDKAVAHVEYHTVHTVFFDHLPLTPPGGKGGHRLSATAGLGLDLPREEVTHVARFVHSGTKKRDPGTGPSLISNQEVMRT